MNDSLIKLKNLAALFLAIVVLASCDDENDFSTNREITDEFTATIPAGFQPGDTVITLQDLGSDLADVINGVIENEDGADLKSLEVVTVQLISSDVTKLSYMDSLAVYLDAANQDDILLLTIPESAQLIATAGPVSLDQASLNLDLEQVNVRGLLGRTSSYDIYFQPFLNDSFDDIVEDRILEINITFRALIST